MRGVVLEYQASICGYDSQAKQLLLVEDQFVAN